MKTLNSFLNINSQYGGIFLIIFGVLILLLAISNAEWFFGENKTFNIEKIQGWVNLFGRNTTRFIMGLMAVFLIAFGIFWLWVYKK